MSEGEAGNGDSDPVRARRARIERWARSGQRLGYASLGVALVTFAIGAVGEFTPAGVAIVVAALAVGSALLLPAIVVGYGVRAADREDRRRGNSPGKRPPGKRAPG